MNTAFGFPWSARVVQVMTPIFGVVAPLIDPAGQCTANPIMPLSCRGVGMTGSPLGPAPQPGPRP